MQVKEHIGLSDADEPRLFSSVQDAVDAGYQVQAEGMQADPMQEAQVGRVISQGRVWGLWYAGGQVFVRGTPCLWWRHCSADGCHADPGIAQCNPLQQDCTIVC